MADDVWNADRMIRKAAESMQGAAYGPATLRKSKLVVPAVLRELSRRTNGWSPDELEALAEQIEEQQ